MIKFTLLASIVIGSVLTSGCSIISNSVTTDADLLVRAGKALNQNPESLKLRTRSTTTTSVTWQVEDISQTRYDCEYLSFGVVDDAGTTCKEVKKVVTWSCPEGFYKYPGFIGCHEKERGLGQHRILRKEDLQKMGYWHESYE